MARCRRCGEENPDRARFCMECGNPLRADRPARDTRKTLTVLFADVAESTALGERVDAEAVRAVISRYFEEAKAVVEGHGGTVERFLGDALMGVFGLPEAHEDDAFRAVRAAAEMSERLRALNQQFEAEWGFSIAVRTGVNTGEVVVGSAAGVRLLTGDAVNVAARLEQAAGPSEILIGASTYRLVKDAVRIEPAEPLSLKGKALPVPAFRLAGIVPGRPALVRRLDSPIVGRDREIDALRRTFEDAAVNRSSRGVLLLGPGGAGKSRLAAELRRLVAGRAAVLTGRCLPYGEAITFWPVAEVVRQAAGITANDSVESARDKLTTQLGDETDASTIVERVAALVWLSQAGAPPAETFWAVRRFFEAVAKHRPLVVEFDDLHWAQPTLLDLLEHVSENVRGGAILFLLAGRPELSESRPGWLERYRTLTLDPLTDDDCRSLIANLLGRASLAPVVATRIVEVAEGNPLFVEEMLSTLIDEGLLRHDDAHWVPTRDLSRLTVPATIDGLLAARLDRLADDEREVIEGAAVVGRVFRREAVAELSSDPVRQTLDGHLEALVGKDFIRPDQRSSRELESFRFRHALIRDAAYAGVPKRARAELHERFARWLDQSAGERRAEHDDVVGYHFEQAYRYRAELAPISESDVALARLASSHLASAGRRALGLGDVATAVGLLSRAAALPPRQGDVPLDALADLGVARMEAGELTDAAQVFADVLARSETPDARPTAVLARVLLAWVRWFTDPEGKTEESRREAELAIRVFEEIGDDRGLAKAWRLLGDVYWTECRIADSERAWHRALRHARRAADNREERQLLGSLATASFHGPTPVPVAIATCEEILRRAGGNRTVEAKAERSLAGLWAMRGQFHQARQSLEQAQTIFEDLGQQIELGANQMAGAVELLAGDPLAAERHLRTGYEILDRIGERSYLPSVTAMLAAAVYLQERWDEAAKLAERSRRYSSSDDVDAQVMCRGTLAKTLARRGQYERAEVLAREAVVLAGATDALDMHATALVDLAEVLRLAGRSSDALPVVNDAVRLYERKGNVVSAELARRSADVLVAAPSR